MEQIKVGDIVRVSEKTPIEYSSHGEHALLCVINSVVRCVVNDYAMCEPIFVDGVIQTPFLIPTKYLIKVDAEAKEPKIKGGDRVRNIESGLIGVVDKIVYGNVAWVNCVNGKRYHWKSNDLELVQPTEQTEAEKNSYDGISEETANEISNKLETYSKALFDIADSFDWQRYEADLAKEIVLKLIGNNNDEQMLAKYAVNVAKFVVENLKKKEK